MLVLSLTKRTDERLLERMKVHYSQPKGFVGRSLCFAIKYNDQYYGHIIAGSATRFLPGRNEFLNVTKDDLNGVINNIFYNISPVNGKYPTRNFTTKVLKGFMKASQIFWFEKYRDKVVGFETLVEKPRTGELYRRAGWTEVGETIGYTCKRVAGKGTDSWSGKRMWNTDKNSLRPKTVLCYKVSENSIG